MEILYISAQFTNVNVNVCANNNKLNCRKFKTEKKKNRNVIKPRGEIEAAVIHFKAMLGIDISTRLQFNLFFCKWIRMHEIHHGKKTNWQRINCAK